jgi:hypothetical protein
MELNQALADIGEIRMQMARAGTFKGYRAATITATGGIAVLAAVVQPFLVPAPLVDIGSYLALWIGCAVVCMGLVFLRMISRCRRTGSPLAQEMAWQAIEHFLPAALAGAMLTAVILVSSTESVWMLPGLWQTCVGLGIFASCRIMPREVRWAGAFYLLAGSACIALGQGNAALSPWVMALPFGLGQLLTAAILFLKLEYDREPR